MLKRSIKLIFSPEKENPLDRNGNMVKIEIGM
jgi:hypothetical protein